MTVRYANYAREKSRYGGFVGSIQIHATPGVGVNNDPLTAIYKDNLPAGYLKCDGSIRNAKEFYALSQVLGVGDDCRFKKDGVILRNADSTTGDLGQFQLPDLGSKVIIAGRSTGIYNSTTIEEQTGATAVNRVGPEVQVVSNVGNRINVNYIGNFQVSASSSTLSMLGSPKFLLNADLSTVALDIENFQGHAHNSSQTYINQLMNHRVGGDGKDRGQFSGNSGAGNILDESAQNTSTGSTHKHKITKPTVYSSNFTYSHSQFDASAENVVSYVDVSLETVDKLDQVVTPFILVEYIIKF